MQDKDTRKQLAFDLDTTITGLKTYYNKDRASAYKELQNALESNGFERVQYSVYHSKKAIDYHDFKLILDEIDAQITWLTLCLTVAL